MLGLLLTLLSTLEVPAAATPPPALLSALSAAYVGHANDPGACSGPLAAGGVGVVSRVGDALMIRVTEDPDKPAKLGRLGGCGNAPAAAVRAFSLPDLRPIAANKAPAPDSATSIADLVATRCVSRKTLRSYASLVLLGGPLTGFAIELSPSRSIITARLFDARKTPAEVYPLGKVGVRTLEWCDVTDIADGHCPNPANGEVLQAVLVDDRLVLTFALGFGDICGQDDLVLASFPLPPAVRRSLAP